MSEMKESNQPEASAANEGCSVWLYPEQIKRGGYYWVGYHGPADDSPVIVKIIEDGPILEWIVKEFDDPEGGNLMSWYWGRMTFQFLPIPEPNAEVCHGANKQKGNNYERN